MINKQTKELLDAFSKIELFKKHKVILIGGTALAFHLGHRVSFDLDICFPFANTLPELDFLEQFDEVIPIKFDQAIIDTAINEGGDIDEVIRRFIINGVKVDFVVNPSSNIYESEILQNDDAKTYRNLRIASVDAIFKLKSLLILNRNKIRDLYDIVYMLKHCGYSGKDIIDTITHYRFTYLPKHIIALIEAKKQDPFDTEGIENPKMNLKEYKELKAYLLKEISKK